jgi:hypothetical protein
MGETLGCQNATCAFCKTWQVVVMQRIGDIPQIKKLAKVGKALTPDGDKLLKVITAIRLDPDKSDAAYMARQLVQCTLPHRNPGNVPLWKRSNGRLILSIVPGINRETSQTFGFPYGSIPRLLLFWMTTEAVKTKSRRLELGHNLSDFMLNVGLNPDNGSGKRSDARRLREQMVRLFKATISFDEVIREQHRHGLTWLDMQVAPEGQLWWDPKQPDQSVLWGSWIELGEKFFQAITATPVPVDTRALKALKRSPLALDLYALAVYKAFVANQRDEKQFVPWDGLLEQLGANYDPERIDHFKTELRPKLLRVAECFPERLKYEWSRDGLSFLPGTKLPISPTKQLTPKSQT